MSPRARRHAPIFPRRHRRWLRSRARNSRALGPSARRHGPPLSRRAGLLRRHIERYGCTVRDTQRGPRAPRGARRSGCERRRLPSIAPCNLRGRRRCLLRSRAAPEAAWESPWRRGASRSHVRRRERLGHDNLPTRRRSPHTIDSHQAGRRPAYILRIRRSRRGRHSRRSAIRAGSGSPPAPHTPRRRRPTPAGGSARPASRMCRPCRRCERRSPPECREAGAVPRPLRREGARAHAR